MYQAANLLKHNNAVAFNEIFQSLGTESFKFSDSFKFTDESVNDPFSIKSVLANDDKPTFSNFSHASSEVCCFDSFCSIVCVNVLTISVSISALQSLSSTTTTNLSNPYDLQR